jgi:hypothetical protein
MCLEVFEEDEEDSRETLLMEHVDYLGKIVYKGSKLIF